MSKDFQFGEDARKKILNGVNTLSRAVSTTLGPRGRNVLMQKSHGGPHSTKDGVSVAREVSVEDPFENMGVQSVRQAAEQTCTDAGDGTTTSTILAQSLYSEGAKLVAAGHSPDDIKRGIDWATGKVVNYLGEMSRSVESSDEISQVGTISSNGDQEVGDMIARAMEEVGNEGVITLEEGNTLTTELVVQNGYQFDRGYLNPNFVTNEKLEAVMEDARVLVTDMPLNNSAVMQPLMEKYHASEHQGKPLLVISQSVDGEALALMVINHLRGTFPCAAVKTPGFGDRSKEMLQDIATLTGATMISEEMGYKLENFDVDWVGRARRVVVTKGSTTIVEGLGNPEDVEARVEQIRHTIASADSDYDREKQEERLAKLVGGVAVISVGAATEGEMKEKKDRVEDALAATRAAVQEGIVPGGGVALLRASKWLAKEEVPEELKYGTQLVQQALQMPLRQIVMNANQDASVVANKVLDNSDVNHGFNARTGEYEDLMASGVIDPSKVVRSALQNASSVAGLMLTTECMIAVKPDDSKGNGAGQNPMMGM